MKVRDAMIPHKECVGPNDRASAAADVMAATKTSTLPVLDHRQVSGTVAKDEMEKTAKDIDRAPQLLKVRDVMKEHAVSAFEEEELEPVETRMKAAGLTVIPVLDDQKRIVGMLHRPESSS